MDNFNEFVNHFNDSADQQLVLSPTKQLVLTGKRNALVADQAIVNSEVKALLDLAAEEAALALTHSAGMTYAGLKALIGTVDAPGRLQHLEGILNAVPPADMVSRAKACLTPSRRRARAKRISKGSSPNSRPRVARFHLKTSTPQYSRCRQPNATIAQHVTRRWRIQSPTLLRRPRPALPS